MQRDLEKIDCRIISCFFSVFLIFPVVFLYLNIKFQIYFAVRLSIMSSKIFRAAYAALFGIAVLWGPLGAQAANAWSFTSHYGVNNCAAFTNTGSASGNCESGHETSTRDYNSNAGTEATRVRVSGWANSRSDSPDGANYNDNFSLHRGAITHYGNSGLGVNNQGAGGATIGDYNEGGYPEHAIDNNGRTDMVLFDFQAKGGEGAT
jgi:hypothetical protein